MTVTRRPRNTKHRATARRPRESEALRARLVTALCLLVAIFVVVGLRLVWIATLPAAEPSTRSALTAEVPRRGDIYDRNGVLLASSLAIYSLYADPQNILDVEEAIQKLTTVLPQLSKNNLRRKLTRKGRFVWLERQLTPEQVKQVNNLGLPGLGFRENEARFYPYGRTAAHTLGGVNIDGKGRAGVELAQEETLANGRSLSLTIDIRLQNAMRSVLTKTVKTTGAKAAWGVVIEPSTGEILTLTSLPDYDPNHYGRAARASWRNRATLSIYEMGSIFKMFTLASALENGLLTPETPLDCRRPIKVGRHTIHDFHPKARIMSAAEVLTYSSNIGAARIADMFSENQQYETFRNLGLLTPIKIGVAEAGTPQYPRGHWGRLRNMTMAFGHGIAVTPMHVAGAAAALMGDGHYRAPHLIRDMAIEKPVRVFSPATTSAMRHMLRLVVQHGTGGKAAIPGYDIGGKTGTAEKAGSGGYDKNRNLASFIGAFPLENPRFIALIMVDEPTTEWAGGGRAAAPAFADFAQRAAAILGIAPGGTPTESVPAPAGKPPHYKSPDMEELDEIFRIAATAGG